MQPAPGSESVKLVAVLRQGGGQQRPRAAQCVASLTRKTTQLAAQIANGLQGMKFGRYLCGALRVGAQIPDDLPPGPAEPQLVVRSPRPADFTADPPLTAQRLKVILAQPELCKLRI